MQLTRTPVLIFFTPLFFLVLFTATSTVYSAESSKKRAEEILDKVDDLWRGDSSHGKFTMEVKTKHYTRKMGMEAWSKGKEKSLIRILSPKKEKGTATLKSEDSIYTYLPKTDRTIRLTSGMMGGSWMGSHFTNDDLVRESRLKDDYEFDITFEGDRKGIEVIEITLIPKPDAAVVWGKVVVVLRTADLMPVEQLYYDEDGLLVRTMSFSDIKMMGGRNFPARMKIVPKDKPDEFTELVYEEMRFNLPLDDSLFSVSQLRKM
ncbi:MAG: outer membrane lipoprotein-sorting protein [Nitrospinota bacterium]|nr:outer membrane lipoprotein-sorting protein [Nitrospinota bacterium]